VSYPRHKTTIDEASTVGKALHVNWDDIDVEQLRRGMDVEFEHGAHDPQTDVTHDDLRLTAMIALAHLKEFPDYYVRLERMEEAAKRDRDATRTAPKLRKQHGRG
jgi:hypothetical protein